MAPRNLRLARLSDRNRVGLAIRCRYGATVFLDGSGVYLFFAVNLPESFLRLPNRANQLDALCLEPPTRLDGVREQTRRFSRLDKSMGSF
jgi:hypothetical protein